MRPAPGNSPERSAGRGTAAGRSVGRGTAAGRSVGAPVKATDEDAGEILTYSLESGGDNDAFDIGPRTGQLRTKAVLDYDPEGANEYTVTVEVYDGFNPGYDPSNVVDARVTVTITVTQVAQRVSSAGGGGGGFGPCSQQRPEIHRRLPHVALP